MHGASPTERYKRKLPWVITTAHGNQVNLVGHASIDNAVHASGQRLWRYMQTLCHVTHDLVRLVHLQRQVTSGKVVRVKIAQHQARICHGGDRATTPVAGWTSLSYPLHQIVGRSRHFHQQQTLLIMQADDVSKRATNVNGDLDHGSRSFTWRSTRCMLNPPGW